MPLAHSLRKVSKTVSKSNAAIHVKGRNFKKLNRATLREQKLTNKKAEHKDYKQNELSIVKYFQDEVNQVLDKETFTLEDMKAFIENFISRFDEDLNEMKASRRPGRPPSSKQQILEELIKSEHNKYKSGTRVPDISDKVTVDKLRLWNGTIGGVTAFKYVNVHKDMQQLPLKEETMN